MNKIAKAFLYFFVSCATSQIYISQILRAIKVANYIFFMQCGSSSFQYTFSDAFFDIIIDRQHSSCMNHYDHQ